MKIYKTFTLAFPIKGAVPRALKQLLMGICFPIQTPTTKQAAGQVMIRGAFGGSAFRSQ